jgi:hypothetical protein
MTYNIDKKLNKIQDIKSEERFLKIHQNIKVTKFNTVYFLLNL